MFFRAKHVFHYYFPLLLWMGMIFLLSSVPGNGAAYEMPLGVLLERKTAHVIEYFILTLLSFRVFALHFPHARRVSLMGAMIFAFLYASSDEFHQLFVFGRTGKLTDVLIDFFGITLAGLLLASLEKRKR